MLEALASPACSEAEQACTPQPVLDGAADVLKHFYTIASKVHTWSYCACSRWSTVHAVQCWWGLERAQLADRP
jgi:hypothetical protein